MALTHLPQAVEERARCLHLDVGPPEFGRVTTLDNAAQLHGRRLLAVADGKDGKARVEDHLGGPRGTVTGDGIGPAGQDHSPGLHAVEGGFRALERDDFRIDAHFAHPPADELGDLGTEVDDEDLVVVGCHAGRIRQAAGVCKSAVKAPWRHPTGV